MARAKKEAALTPEERLQAALVPDWEWPYKLPENWCWTALKNTTTLLNGDRGVNYPSKKDYLPDGVPFINAGAIVDGVLDRREFNFISKQKYDSLRAGKVKQNDILYCLRGSLGKTAIVDFEGDGAISSSLCILRVNEATLVKYLYYLLNSEVISQQQDSAENGSAQPNLSAASVMQYSVPLPPLAEQQRIVDRIESLFAKLDEAKEKAQTVLDSFETRKAAILHKAFTGELTAKWRAEHAVEKSSWVVKKVGEFAEVKGGKRLPKGHVLITEKTDHPYLRIADFGENTIDQSDLHYITDETYAEISRYIITSEDVYLSIVGSIGKTGVIPKELDGANLTENAARIISQSTLPKYLCAYLSSPITQDDIQGRIRSATLGKLSLLNIKDISVPIPTKEEQAEIVRILDSLFAKEQQAKEAAEAVLEKIDLLKKSVLARAFRGELGTNDPNDEPAVELLKKIL